MKVVFETAGIDRPIQERNVDREEVGAQDGAPWRSVSGGQLRTGRAWRGKRRPQTGSQGARGDRRRSRWPVRPVLLRAVEGEHGACLRIWSRAGLR